MTQEYLSPSGKYKLVIEQIETKLGCWNYTRGTVSYGDETLIKVDRNYSCFPFLFIEDHPDGYDYLVCGVDYQGQTVVRLQDREVKNHLPEEAKKGHAFCWGEYQYNRELNILIVDGCHWACPYEYKFYDFSEPMAGWPEIETDSGYIDSQGKFPSVDPDGLITCYETRVTNEDCDDEEDIYQVVATKTYELKDRTLWLVAGWVDEKEKVRREEFRVAQEKYEAALAKYKAEDPLYLLVRETINSKIFGEPVSYGESMGQCHNTWHPSGEIKGSNGRLEQRICFDLVRREKKDEHNKLTIRLEWGREAAPIKVALSRDGKRAIDTWYEHSIEGMQQAIAFAKEQNNE